MGLKVLRWGDVYIAVGCGERGARWRGGLSHQKFELQGLALVNDFTGRSKYQWGALPGGVVPGFEVVGGSIQVLGACWGWLCSPGILYLPSLNHPSPPTKAHGLANCLVCLCKIVVEWRDRKDQHKCVDRLTELHRF